MKEINVSTHSVPATARSKNYQTALATTAASGGGATTPSVVTPTGGAADTAKVAQNLAEDSTDWAKILRKDIDERTENSFSIGKNLTVDGQAILNDVVANTGTFGGLLKAAAATITGALLASTVSATTMNATTFIGELQGNAATATKLKTARTIWGQSFDGSGNVNGDIVLPDSKKIYLKDYDNGHIIRHYNDDSDGFGVSVGFCVKSYIDDINPIFFISRTGNSYFNGNRNFGIGTTAPSYKLDVNGNARISNLLSAAKGGIFYGQDTFPTNVGSYVLNYVSATYGPRVTAYDGTNYQKLSLGKLISGTNFQLELNTDGTSKFNGGVIAAGVESSKGGLFYGQYATMPTGLGTYVANYVSDAYGARVLAYDGAAYKDLKLGAMPTSGVFGMTLSANGDTRVGYNIGTSNFASHTTGWNVSANGAADFRNIYADELRVQAFTADISQALAGSDYLTKSVSKLSANFVVPAVNSTVRIIVDDIEGMPATQCFTNGDYIRFRAFNRTSGLTIANVWGTVVLDTTFGTNGYLNGTQAYTFTCKATSGAGLTVFKGSEVLDYGTSGSGMISRTTLDAQGSPYEQIATWVSDPSVSANYTVHARLGNLGGIANCNGYGVYTDNGFFTGKIVIGDLTKTANFLSFDNVNGLQVKIGGTSVATTTDVSTAQTTAINTASSDATTKANAAYSNAVTYTNTQITATNNSITAAVNGIQIGGRNILLNSSLKVLSKWALNGSGTTVNTDKTINGNNSILINYTNLVSNYYYGLKYSDIYEFTKNVPYSFSINSYTTDATTIDKGAVMEIVGLDSSNNRIIDRMISIIPTANNIWQLFKIENVIFPDSVVKVQIAYFIIRNGILYVSSPMAEQSNKCSNWSPAPEDVDASISAAQSTAIGTAATNAAALYVTQTAYSSQVTILQNSINAKVSQTDFNALGNRVSTAESTITQHSTDIASKVAQTDFNALNTRVGTAESNITQNATAIATKVSQTTFDALGTRVTTAESTITQHTTDIGLRVTKDGVIGAINLTSETATISATKINLVGAVTISSISSDALSTIQGYSTTAVNNLSNAHGNFTYIDGNSVYTGTLTANQVNAVGINASSVTTGILSADRIGANTITGDKLVMNTITALGNVTAGSFNIGSGKFVVDVNGNLTAVNANISGAITATSGSVGPFTISQLDGLTSTSGDQSLLLKARLIRFTGGTTSAVYIGTDVVPGSWGGSFTCPVRVEESRVTTTSGNVGIYLSVTGASVNDSSEYIANSALFLDRGVITGFRTRQRRLNYSQTLSLLDTTIIDTSSSSDSTYTLPVPNEDGHRIEFITANRYIRVKPNTGARLQYGIDTHLYTSSEYVTVNNGNYAICIYDAVNSLWIMRDFRAS